MLTTTDAKKCFEENIRLFANANTEPEKFNLYHGLVAIADAIASMQSQLSDLDNRLRQLEVGDRVIS